MASARTINLPGSQTDTQQYELAPGLLQYVQSVYVVVDNTAGAAAKPTLTISEQSGVVIAKKRQGESIPAAGSGSATWALRLTDEGGAGIQFDIENVGGFLHVTASADVDIETHAMFLYALGFAAVLEVLSEGSLLLEGDTQIELNSGGAWLISVDSVLESVADNVSVQVGSGGYALQVRGPVAIDTAPGSDGIVLRIPNGASVEVQDAADNPIFRVNSDGSLQGKTGKALTFNL